MIRILLIASLLIVFQQSAEGQSRNVAIPIFDTVKPYGRTYHKPQFPGGDTALANFTRKNLRYPLAAKENSIEGRVMVRALIDEQGNVTKVTLIRSVGGGCDEEAVRFVKSMPRWEPATYKGRPVRAVEVIPVIFKLE